MRYLRENTATRITVGPFYDVTDGVTPEIALTVTNSFLTFIVDDAGVPTLVLDTAPTASGGANDMVHIPSDVGGYYDLELAAADVNYTGRATLSIHDTSVHLPVFHEFQIVSANVYDSLFTDGDVLDVSVTQWLGTAAATPSVAGVPEVDLTHLFGVILAEGGAGRLAAAFNKLFDVATPTLVASDVMRGTDSANTTVPDAAGTAPTVGEITTELNSNLALSATALDLILKASTFALAMADAIWDEVLTGATHNVTNSSGKKLRQIEAAFVVDSGTAQAGSSNTITLASTANSTNDNIYRGDRITIVAGTGVGEHDICIAYDASTRIATMAENWIVTPDNTSEYDVSPASVDIETWQHKVVTASAGGLPDVNVNEVGDTAQTAGDLAALIVTADTAIDVAVADLANGTDGLSALKTLIDTVNSDLANGTDGLGALKTLIDTVNSDLANGTDGLGALKALIDASDIVVDAIKVVTDKFAFTVANQVDSNTLQVEGSDATDQIKAACDAALDTAISELGVAVPATTPTLRTGMMLMYMALRNRLDVQTSGTDALEIRNNAGTIIAKKLLTDGGSDYSEAKMTSG